MFIIGSIILFYCIWSLKLFLSQPMGFTCFSDSPPHHTGSAWGSESISVVDAWG